MHFLFFLLSLLQYLYTVTGYLLFELFKNTVLTFFPNKNNTKYYTLSLHIALVILQNWNHLTLSRK